MDLSSSFVGIASLIAIVVFIYAGVHIAVALGTVSFVGVLLLKGNIDLPLNLLGLAIADSVSDEAFATVPLFVMMGLVVSRCGLGRDVYEFANDVFHGLRGGLGVATVAANAIFAAVTGSSIASASVFAKVAVPEMRRYRYGKRFTVGIVAGSSVLGMIIPPSVMLIIYAVITEQSVGAMFLAGVLPGLLLAVAFCVAIVLFAAFWPRFVGGDAPSGERVPLATLARDAFTKLGPVLLLVLVVLGGLYGGILTPVESGAAGTVAAAILGCAQAPAHRQRDLGRAGRHRPHHRQHPVPDHRRVDLQPHARHRRAADAVRRMAGGDRDVLRRLHVAVRAAAAGAGHDLRHRVDHPDRRAAVPAGAGAAGHQPDLVRHRHRGRRRDRPADAAVRHLVFRHQGHHRRPVGDA